MKDYTTRVELMAIPIVAVLFGIGAVLYAAGAAGVWAWVFVGLAGLVLAGALIARYTKHHPHPAAETPAPAAAPAPAADEAYRVLVIADESCVDPAFSAQLAAHAAGRTVEALVVAPAIGSRLARWTGDESQFVDARKHLDDTVAALAAAGITATGETGADDPFRPPTTACGSSRRTRSSSSRSPAPAPTGSNGASSTPRGSGTRCPSRTSLCRPAERSRAPGTMPA